MPQDRLERNLWRAGVLFAVGSAVHMVDHLRRGQGSITDELYWAGNLATIVQVTVITLIFTRHRLAPLAAAAAGFPLALGFLAAHWLPEWSAPERPGVGRHLVAAGSPTRPPRSRSQARWPSASPAWPSCGAAAWPPSADPRRRTRPPPTVLGRSCRRGAPRTAREPGGQGQARPNQRWMRLEPNSALAAASASDGPS